jgi:hypothetical protein
VSKFQTRKITRENFGEIVHHDMYHIPFEQYGCHMMTHVGHAIFLSMVLSMKMTYLGKRKATLFMCLFLMIVKLMITCVFEGFKLFYHINRSVLETIYE